MQGVKRNQWINKPFFNSRVQTENVTNREKWLGYFLGPCGAVLFNALLSSYLNVFYTDVLKMADATFLGGLPFLIVFPVLSQVLSAMANLVIGYVIDRTKTGQGKARPWILLSAPLITVFGILLFMVPNASTSVKVWWIFLSYNFFYSCAYSIYLMSHSLMVPLSTREEKQRSMVSIFSSLSSVMMTGIIVGLIFPMIILPVLGANQDVWIKVMSTLAVLAFPLTLIEYFFTKERVTEEGGSEEKVKIPLGQQVKAACTDKFWVILITYQFIFTLSSMIKNTGLIYYCNYVLGTYNDGITQTLVAAIGGLPMGIGVALIWPLTKRFGKRNITLLGFVLSIVGGLICISNPTNYVMVLIGQFIKNLGLVPASYVFPALFGDVLEHVEWKKGFRCDGFSASILCIITTLAGGLGTTVFNAMLGVTGEYKPPVYDLVSNMTVGFTQTQSINNVFIFCFLGLEVITHLILVALLLFFGIEKMMPKIQADIRARKKKGSES